MIERYYRFDTARMLADHPENKVTLANLKRQLASMDGSKAIQYDEKVQTTRQNDAVEKLIIKRANLNHKIEEYQRDIALIDACINRLSEDDKTIIREFFWRRQSRTAAVVALEGILHLERSAIYERRAEILKRLERMIFG